MKIENIKVNSFGKLKNKEINFSNGINLIYGNNEAGKSTLLKFIQNIFYGTSKNKKGKNFSDYDLYKPWNDDDFSGKITYKLDSGEKFEVYREFGKKSPKIYNEQLEDISKQFNINKNTGNEFFFEQTRVDEFMFLSSIVSKQQEVKLNTQDQNVYIQKIANLASTGDDTISFKKAMDKLNKKQLEEIGTDRTQGKPINIIKNKINMYEKQVGELSRYKQSQYEIEEKEKILEKEIQNNKYRNKFIKELQEIKQTEKIETEKLKLNENIREKNNEQIETIEQEINETVNRKGNNKTQASNIEKMNYKLYIILFVLCVALGIVSFIVFRKITISLVFTIPVILIILLCLFKKKKIEEKIEKELDKQKNINNELDEKIKILRNKIDVINKNNEELDKQIELINEELIKETTLKKEQLKSKYFYQIKFDELNYLFASEELNKELEKSEGETYEKELKLNMIRLEKKKIIENLENLVDIEEELQSLQQEYNQLIDKNNKIIKARELLQKAYENMKNSVTPKFTSNLSSNIEKISNGKYNKVWINDEEGMIVGLPNGEYVPAEKLSTGTIEQLYLSLRLSMAKDISAEKMPIILDEAFAYYDDERLRNVIEFLMENFKEHQIILFTCTHREENMLKTLSKTYQFIDLNS